MTPAVRFRVDFNPGCSIGAGKIALLEQVARSGSLSGAARALGMSYRRAWLLLDDMNRSFDSHVARASVGGVGGGGVTLTEFGQQLIDEFRTLQSGLQALTSARLRAIASHARASSRERKLSAVSIRRALPQGSKRATRRAP